ncbi:MAG: site-2 protease family protein, partial [Ignavibacteriaceae bacterium]
FLIVLNLNFGIKDYVLNIFWYGVFFNIFLFAFNLLPIPPLDGSHILFDIYPNKITGALLNLGLYGSIILLILIYSPLWGYFMKFINLILNLFLRVAGLNNV